VSQREKVADSRVSDAPPCFRFRDPLAGDLGEVRVLRTFTLIRFRRAALKHRMPMLV
jgi:hypothetical protein